MAFCSKCGNQVAEGSAFCPQCGNQLGIVSVNGAQVPYKTPPVQTVPVRQQSLVEMHKMLDHFSKKTNEYNEYDQLNDRLAVMLRGYSAAGMVWGIILVVIFGLWTLAGFGGAIAAVEEGNATALISCLISVFFLFVISAVGVMLIVLNVLGRKKHHQKVDWCRDRINDLAEELTQHFHAYGYCPIGPEYTNPYILQQLTSIIQSGRAETPKEAINVLLDDAHKNSVEFAAMLTARNAQAAAAGATASAVFSAASFFFK